MNGVEESKLTCICWVVWIESSHWVSGDNWAPSLVMLCITAWFLETSLAIHSGIILRWLVGFIYPLLLVPSSACCLFNWSYKFSSYMDFMSNPHPLFFVKLFENDGTISKDLYIALAFFSLSSFLWNFWIISWHFLYSIMYGNSSSKYVEFN